MSYISKKQQVLQKQLYAIVAPYSNWYNNCNQAVNEQAKNAIITFYYELLKHRPSSVYINHRCVRNLYLAKLYEFRKAIVEKQYMRACNELLDFIHFHEVLQGRVYYNLIAIIDNLLFKECS